MRIHHALPGILMLLAACGEGNGACIDCNGSNSCSSPAEASSCNGPGQTYLATRNCGGGIDGAPSSLCNVGLPFDDYGEPYDTGVVPPTALVADLTAEQTWEYCKWSAALIQSVTNCRTFTVTWESASECYNDAWESVENCIGLTVAEVERCVLARTRDICAESPPECAGIDACFER